MGNTVGSKDFLGKNAEDYYILGLWLADGYWRASSVGLTSVNRQLIKRFQIFLLRIGFDRIKTRTYFPREGTKRRQVAWQVYVNNRALTREFLSYKKHLPFIPSTFIPAYLAGRIDGDGHIDKKHRPGAIRIAYGDFFDAKRDQDSFGVTNVSLYQYTAARTYVLYLKKSYREKVVKQLFRFSIKLAP